MAGTLFVCDADNFKEFAGMCFDSVDPKGGREETEAWGTYNALLCACVV
jgi:hypothetical protein